MKTKPFNVSVGLRQGCVLSSFLFIIYMEKIDRDNSSSSGVTFGECNVRSMLFVNDFALLSSNKSDLQYALDRFPDACLDATSKSSRQRGRMVKAPCSSSTWSRFKTYSRYYVVSLGKTLYATFPCLVVLTSSSKFQSYPY